MFTRAFADSNIGALVALEGADALRALLLPFGPTYLVVQVGMLLLWWGLSLPLAAGGRYRFP